MARMTVTISFDDEKDYNHVKDQSNSSDYIRKLVRNDRIQAETIDKKFEDLKKYIDSKLSGITQQDDLKDKLHGMLEAFS